MDGSAIANVAARPVSKTIEVMGHDAEIFGYATDEYFRDAQVHAQNNPVLIREAMALPKGGVVVDVGANIGLTMLTAARACWPSRYIAVEPTPRAQAALALTAASNGVVGFEMVPCALGSAEGEITFSQRDFLAGSHKCPEGGLRVPVRTLDEVAATLRLERLDLLKIDVEGMEQDVLEGAEGVLREFRPMVVMEFSSYTLTAMGERSPMAVARWLMDVAGGAFSAERGGLEARVHNIGDARQFLLENMERVTEDIWFRPT